MAAITWVLLGTSATCLFLLAYPYLLYPQALQLLRKRKTKRDPIDLTTSILFCAHNEIECLPAKLQNLRVLKELRPDLEILAYDDSSNDGTYELLAQHSDLLTMVASAGRTGKAAGMKELVARASGDVLVFTDANIIMSADAVERLLPYYGDAEVGGVCCTIKVHVSAGSLTSQIGSRYVALDDRLQQLESDTGNVMGATGGLFSVRRELYPHFPDTVQDDFTASMNIIFQGRRLIKAPDVIGFERAVARSEEEFRRKVRIGARAYHTHVFLRPGIKKMTRRDRFKYYSRKVLRWYGGMFLAAGILLGIMAIATIWSAAAIMLVVALFVAGGLSAFSPAGPLAAGREILLAILATLAGVILGMGGQTYATWAPAKSR